MSRASRAAWAAAAAAGALIIAWVVAALLMVNRGYDVTDEGFYLLSYRWWDSTSRVFTGVQYIYGPVFQLLGWSIPGLRVVRIASVLVVHATFGWAFMSWLRTRRPAAPPTRAWELAGTLAVVAAGGVGYGWLPLSPGYNDAVLLGSMLLASIVLWSLRVVVGGAPLPVLAAVCIGPLVLALILAKWVTALGTIPFLVVVGALALRSAGARGWGRFLVAAVVSTAGCALLMQVFVTSLPTLLHQVISLSGSVSSENGSPVKLLRYDLTTTVDSVRSALAGTVAALVVAVVVALLHRLVGSRNVVALVVLAPLAALVKLTGLHRVLPGGGGVYLPLYVTVLISLSLVVLAVALLGQLVGRLRGRGSSSGDRDVPARPGGTTPDVFVVAMLVLLPAVQALGTNNVLSYVAVNQFACWVALLVAASTASGWSQVARWLTVSVTACAVVVAVTSGMDGVLRHPYRTSGFEQASVAVGGPGPVGSMRVDAATAARFREVRAAVGDLPAGSPVMAFDRMAGVVLLLDGRSVGEVWYDSDPHRTAAGIEATCRHSWPWGRRAPVVIFDRPQTATDTHALASCGFSLSSGYRETTISTGGPDLQVFVPTGSRAPR